MKRQIMTIFAMVATLAFAASCATGSGGVPLRDTIEQVAERLATDIPAGTSVAVVSFESESESLSRFIIDSLVGALADRGVHVMTRQSVELELVRQEMDFGLTGEVSDATAQNIGHMIGVGIVVTGHLRDIGVTHHFLANAIEVETARHVSVPRFDVRNDRVLRGMIAALDGPSTTPQAGASAQQPLAQAAVPATTLVQQPPAQAPALAQQPPTRAAAPAGMVRVEGGTMMLQGRNVTLSAFNIGRHPVTQGEWFDVMRSNPSHFQGNRLAAGVNWRNLPVENVSWFDAVEFANTRSRRAGLTPAYTISGSGYNRVVTWNRNANGYRLPTEAEWECVDKARKTAIMTTKCPASTLGMIS